MAALPLPICRIVSTNHRLARAGCRPGLFSPLWYDQSTWTMRLSMAPRRRGWADPNITKHWTGAIWLRQRCVPLWRMDQDHFACVSSQPKGRPPITFELRTHCIQSIREAGPLHPQPLGWYRRFLSTSRHNCERVSCFRHHGASLLTASQCDTVGEYRNPKNNLPRTACRSIYFIDVRYFLPKDYITRL